jgi:3-hydroxyacyl-[acyl-carrier-protein] dehydratase
MYDYAWIRATLPYRHPTLLLDQVEAFEPATSIVACKAVTGSEPCYAGLAEDLPGARYAYPRSLVIESFGQAAALLCLASAQALGLEPGRVILFGAARDCVFHGNAYPGEVLRHRAHLDQFVADTAFVTGETRVADRRIAAFGSLVAALRPRPDTTHLKEKARYDR